MTMKYVRVWVCLGLCLCGSFYSKAYELSIDRGIPEVIVSAPPVAPIVGDDSLDLALVAHPPGQPNPRESTSGGANPDTTTTKDTSGSDAFSRISFGAAVALEWNVFKPNIVTDATIDGDGFVRVNTRANTTAGLMLETHCLLQKTHKGDD
jgi:hypothetical protein